VIRSNRVETERGNRHMVRRVVAACAAVTVIGTVGGTAIAARTATSAMATTRVGVVAKEFAFKLSKRTVAKGSVVFTVVNKGHVAHDFKIGGKKTPMLKPGKKATLQVVFRKAGRYRYLCTVPGHAAAGMKGTLTVR
jgi:uncharacterized cupredoxin-like copper-binding protein